MPAGIIWLPIIFFVDFWHNTGVLATGWERIFLPFSLPYYLFALLFGIHLLVVWKHLKLETKQVYCILGMYLLGYACMQQLDAGEVDRYLAPIVPLVFLVLFQSGEAVEKKVPSVFSKGVMGLVVLLMLYSLARTFNNIPRWHERSTLEEKISEDVYKGTWRDDPQ